MSSKDEKDFYEQWGAMKAEQKTQKESIEEIKEILQHMSEKMDNQEKFINKWKGGAFILMGLGAALTWAVETAINYLK